MNPQYSVEGSQNIWIIKPGQNSKGNGIKLVRKLQDAKHFGSMQSRIVQKYIERPLLLPLQPQLNLDCSFRGHKFDIR